MSKAPLWTFDELVRATAGRPERPTSAPVMGLSIDTRTLAPGDLFVALKDQRDAFKKVSESVIELLGKVPPSTAFGPRVFVIHCPMAEASWIQKSDEIANPYFGSEMLECGTVTVPIPTVQP